MPEYTLCYFPVRGLADPIRMIFHHADVKYNFHPVTPDQWQNKKNETPFGKLPVLGIDSAKYGESTAIVRYLGETYGLGGDSNENKLQLDSMVDAMKEIMTDMLKPVYSMTPEDRKAYFNTKLEEMSKTFEHIEKNLAKCKCGYITNSGLTWADMVFFGFYNILVHFMGPDVFGKVPAMKKHYETVKVHPSIVKHMEITKDVPTYPF